MGATPGAFSQKPPLQPLPPPPANKTLPLNTTAIGCRTERGGLKNREREPQRERQREKNIAMGYRTENQTARLQPERVRVCETTLQTPRSVKKEGEEVLQALEQSPQHSPTCHSMALGSPCHLPAPPTSPLPASGSRQPLCPAPGSPRCWLRHSMAPLCLQHRPHGPHWHHHPTQGFPRHPPVNRAALLTFSVSAATAQQHLATALLFPWLTAAPPPATTPLQGGAVTISLTARTWDSSPGPQLEPSTNRGPSPNAHSASPPPLGSITAQCKGRANTARRAKETASVYSVMHVPSPGSESAPGLRAPSAPPAPGTPQQSFPELRLSVQWGTDSRSVGSWSDGLLGRGGGCQK